MGVETCGDCWTVEESVFIFIPVLYCIYTCHFHQFSE